MGTFIRPPEFIRHAYKHFNSIANRHLPGFTCNEKSCGISSGTTIKLHSTMSIYASIGFETNKAQFLPIFYARNNLKCRCIANKCVLQEANVQSLIKISNVQKYSTHSSEIFEEIKSLKGKGKDYIALNNKLIESYINENELEKANGVILSTRKHIKHFFIKSTAVKQYIDVCIKNNRLKDAEKFIHQEVSLPKDAKILASTIIDLAIAFADNGLHKDALCLLENIDHSKIYLDRQKKESSRILDYYVEINDNVRLQGDVQAMNYCIH